MLNDGWAARWWCTLWFVNPLFPCIAMFVWAEVFSMNSTFNNFLACMACFLTEACFGKIRICMWKMNNLLQVRKYTTECLVYSFYFCVSHIYFIFFYIFFKSWLLDNTHESLKSKIVIQKLLEIQISLMKLCIWISIFFAFSKSYFPRSFWSTSFILYEFT